MLNKQGIGPLPPGTTEQLAELACLSGEQMPLVSIDGQKILNHVGGSNIIAVETNQKNDISGPTETTEAKVVNKESLIVRQA